MDKKNTMSICSYCQKEFPSVNDAVEKAIKNNILRFSHGICNRHFIEMYKQTGATDEKIRNVLSRTPTNIPDLKEHPELVKAYSQGIFTQEQLQQVQQNQQTENNKITDRFKKLAGINS